MKRLLLLPVALVCFCLTTSTPAASDKKDKAEDDTQTIVYFGDARPILIKVHLRIDGKSHRSAWRAMTDSLFDHLDMDSSGGLSKKEAAQAPHAALLASQAGFVGGSAVDMDADQDGTVSREELRNHYRKNGLPPFQIGGSNDRSGLWRVRAVDTVTISGGSSSAPEGLNTRFFALLDRDRDGKLSKQELAAAPVVLGKLDKDEDEMLTGAEIQGRREGINDSFQSLAIALDSGIATTGHSRFVVLDEGRTDRSMARQLLDRYAKGGKKRVEAKLLGLTKLDRDEDGWLDAEELARVCEMPPDIELIVRLGKRGKNEPFMEVVRKSKMLRKVEATAQGAVVTIENARLELKGPEEQPKFAKVDFSATYVQQLKLADTDNNGYLDKAEATRSQFFRNLFVVMDRDGDGMLYEKEVIAYLERLGKLRQLVRKGCVSLLLRDEGKGLFEYVDTDGDGRLSVREVRNAARALLALDLDGDGKLTLTEVPRGYRGSFAEGSLASGGGAFRTVVFVSDGSRMGRPTPPPRMKGPVWFRKMDRNRDGDVSRREWLGRAEDFKEADADGDGLINSAEAEAYDQRSRGKE